MPLKPMDYNQQAEEWMEKELSKPVKKKAKKENVEEVKKEA